MAEKFELLDPLEYDEKNVAKLLTPYYYLVDFINLVKAKKKEKPTLKLKDSGTTFPIDDNITSSRNLVSHDLSHTLFGNLPFLLGDSNASYYKSYNSITDSNDFNIIIRDYLEFGNNDSLLEDIFGPFGLDINSLDLFISNQLSNVFDPKIYELISEEDKSSLLLSYLDQNKNHSEKDNIGSAIFQKYSKIYLKKYRSENRRQIFEHNIYEQNVKLAKIILPKLLSGEYEDWIDARKSLICRKIMRRIAELNQEFGDGNGRIRQNDAYTDRLDIENPLSNEDWDRIHKSSQEFNSVLDKFVSALCQNRDYWLRYCTQN